MMGKCHSKARVLSYTLGDINFLETSKNETLKLNPSHSKLLAYTVQRCRSKNMDTIGNVDRDADTVVEALSQQGVILLENCEITTANVLCTFEQIKKRFIKCANETECEGTFIFYFSGHAISTREGDFVGLVPADYSDNHEICITREDFVSWIIDFGLKPKHFLFIIDACYSGVHGSSSPLNSPELPRDRQSIYIMFSSQPNEVSIISPILQHSIYTYCFSRAIAEVSSYEGLQIQVISKKCERLIHSLISLLQTVNKSILIQEQHPGTAIVYIKKGGEMNTDSLQPELPYPPLPPSPALTPPTPPPQLHQKCLDWIEQCKEALQQLKDEGYLGEQYIVDIVLCCMVRTIAYTQVALTHNTHFIMGTILIYELESIFTDCFFEIAYSKVVDTLRKYTELEFKRELGLKEYKDFQEKYECDYLAKHGIKLSNDFSGPA